MTAVVSAHSHGDHRGGVRGVVDEADVRAGKVQILTPRGFMDYSIAENVFAGNAMNRQLLYQSVWRAGAGAPRRRRHPRGFEILPGTRGREAVAHADGYAAVPGKTIPE